ncbi:hypothetical protein BDV12DRAFT_171054 [Aspergillus spectabilis]
MPETGYTHAFSKLLSRNNTQSDIDSGKRTINKQIIDHLAKLNGTNLSSNRASFSFRNDPDYKEDWYGDMFKDKYNPKRRFGAIIVLGVRGGR